MGTGTAANDGASDRAPGRHDSHHERLRSYLVGIVLAVILTLGSFWAADSALVWKQGVPVLLAVLAIAQMGVHLVFFLHISSAPDSTNNILALAFGIFVVGLVVFGSLIIMWNLNANMMPMDQLLKMQR
jgi:cytochrome o ubiquinol oxidase operon protein cyoD